MIRYIQAVNFAFIVPLNMLTCLCILYIYIYRYYSDNHPFRKTSQLEDHCYEPFWVILRLIFVMLFHFLRSVQRFIINVYICFLYYSDTFYCTKFCFSQHVLLCWNPLWGIFQPVLWHFFSISSELFSYEILHLYY